MDSWPCDDRFTENSTAKSKQNATDAARDHPHLQQGMVGAVSLTEKDGRFEWSFLRTNSSKETVNTWSSSEPFKVFPATRGSPAPKSPFGSKLSAQHGANFIRTCMPETDIPLELIREQLEEQDLRLRQLEDFNPYVGNTLVSSISQQSTSAVSGFIAFPMGDVMCDLNISTVNITRSNGLSILPVAGFKRVFDTPIQQLVTGPLETNHMLGIRTYAAVDFMRLRKNPYGSTWEIETGPKLTVQNTGGREAVDVRFKLDNALLVSEKGSVYHIHPFSHKPTVSHVANMTDRLSPKDPEFWRVAFDEDQNSGYILSSDDLSTFDMRSSSSPQKSFELRKASDFLTSVEDCTSDGIVRLCSTSQLYWLDRRNLRRPLLSVRHYRQFDRYLTTTTVGQTCTFLTSRRNNLLSIYDVSYHEDKLLHIRDEPYGVLPRFPDTRSMGETFIQSPFLPAASHTVALKLSQRGAINGSIVALQNAEEDLGVNVNYTGPLKSIEEQSWEETKGLMLEQDQTQLDMSSAYDKIFRQDLEGIVEAEELKANQVYNLVEDMPTYFQKPDIVSEQLLTTFDVAFRSDEEPENPSRSDFLTGSILNSERGYRALRQGRLHHDTLGRTAKWHMDLTSTLQRLGLKEPLTGNDEPFHKYNLEDSDDRSTVSLRYEKRFREQLEVDLGLSSDVYSTHTFTKSPELDQTLETMTEALSLGDLPPEVEFCLLQPVIQHEEGDDDDYGKEGPQKEQEQGLGLGVRLLLKDWEIGTDLANYTYQDPYTVEARPPPRKVPHSPPSGTGAAAPPQLLTQAQTQPTMQDVARPPALASQPSSQPWLASGVRRAADSQGIAPAMNAQSQTQSGDVMMASTQVLPGPFGGRSTKKKPEKKKRMGGF